MYGITLGYTFLAPKEDRQGSAVGSGISGCMIGGGTGSGIGSGPQ